MSAALGAVTAAIVYAIEVHTAVETFEDVIPGAREAHTRQLWMMYGQTLATFMEMLEWLGTPAGHATLVFAAFLLVAGVCWRLAVLDEDRAR